MLALVGLDCAGLRDAWKRRYGAARRLCFHEILRRDLAWRLQADLLGGFDVQTRCLLNSLSSAGPDPEVEQGTRLVHEYRGERHEVTVTTAGVSYRGEAYSSLPEVARAITGSRWNVPRFFGLRGCA